MKEQEKIVKFDVDEATYVGSEEDGVYFQVGEGPGGWWYLTALVDCDTAGFTFDLVTDEGPFTTELEAWDTGLECALDWCINNDVNPGDLPEKMQVAQSNPAAPC